MENHDTTANATGQKTFIVRPKADFFTQRNLAWIDAVGGEPNLSIQDVCERLSVDKANAERDLALIQKLLMLLFAKNDADFLRLGMKFKYRQDAFLERVAPVKPKPFTTRDLVEFYAHLISADADLVLNIPIADKWHYIRHGILNHLGQSTRLFRQQPLFQSLRIAQSQWEGMQPIKSLILMHVILSRIANQEGHRSSKLANELLPALERAIYLKEKGELFLSDHVEARKFCERLANYLLRLQLGKREGMMVHSGQYHHTFYVNVFANVHKDVIEIDFVINNFNATAVMENQQVTSDENKFHPYVNRLSINRRESNGRVRTKFDAELAQLSFYLMMIHLSSQEGMYYVRQMHGRKLLRRQCRICEKTLQYFTDQATLRSFLAEARGRLLDRNSFFSWNMFRSFIESEALNNIVDRLTEHTWKAVIADQEIRLYLLQHIQTFVCLDVLYHPELYGASLMARMRDIERTLPPYRVQKVGNCTVHNLKAALYPHAALDWRQEHGFQSLSRLNFDICMMVVQLIRENVAGVEEKIPDISNLSMPIPVSKAQPAIMRGRRLLDDGRLEEAKRAFLEACQADPEEPYALAGLGFVYEKQQPNEALKYYRQALELTDDPQIMTNCGIIYAGRQETEKAMEYFEEAIRFNPFSANAIYNRAVLLHSQEKFKKCLADINRLVELEPDNAAHVLFRAQLLLDMRAMAQAIDDLNRAYSMGLRSNNLYFTAFELCFMLFTGGYDQAINHEKGEYVPDLFLFFQQMKSFYLEMIRADAYSAGNKEALAFLKSALQKIEDLQHRKLENRVRFWSCIRGIPEDETSTPAEAGTSLNIDPTLNPKNLSVAASI